MVRVPTAPEGLDFGALLAAIPGLSVASFLPVFVGMTGIVYAVAAAILDMIFLTRALRLWHRYSDAASWRLFRYSVTYLVALFAALVIDRLVAPWLPM